MKFIIDAQLPLKLNDLLVENGYDSIHVLDLPKKHLTRDVEIIRFSVEEKRIIISKDSDFYKYYIINKKPEKILMITTGNITNKILINIIQQNFVKIYDIFKNGANVVELNNDSIVVH